MGVRGAPCRRAARRACGRRRRAAGKQVGAALAADLQVTISFGISEAVADGEARDLLANADQHLYAAKRGGRNRVEPHSP